MRAWIGSLALQAYPRRVRKARGDEMLGTLLDAGEDSTGAFLHGITSLVISGLRERARENARVGTRRLVADGFCQAAVLWSLLELLIDFRRYPEASIWSMVLLAGVSVFALAGRDRLGGLCGVAAAVFFVTRGYSTPSAGSQPMLLGHPSLEFLVGRWLGPVVCFTTMVVRPRVRAHDPRRLVWLIPITAIVLTPAVTTTLILATFLFFIGLPVAGIIVLPVDPRLAIASAVLWADISIGYSLGHTRLGLVTVPVVMLIVLITAARGKALTRQSRA